MNSKLFVSADSSLNGNLAVSKNIVGQGTVTVTGLTSLNEKLFVTGDVSLNSKLFVSADSSLNGNLAVSKNIVGQGTMTVTGLTTLNNNMIVTGDASLNSKLFVTGDASLNAKLFVSADSSLNGNLAVSKNIVGQGTVTVTGLTSLNEKLFVTGDVSLNSRLFVSNDVSINGNLGISKNIVGQGTVTVTGLTSLNEKLFVTGDVSLNSRLFVSNDVSINGNLGISKNIISQGTLTMTGLTSLNEKLFVTGDASLNSKLFVSADSSLNGNLAVSKNIIGQGTLTVTGNTSLNSRLTVTGETTLNSGLGVALDSSFNQKLFVAGNLTVGTSATTYVGIGMDPSSNYRMNVSGIVNATGGVLNNGIVVDGPTGILSNDVYENYCSQFNIVKTLILDGNGDPKEMNRVAMSSDGKYITLVGTTQGYPVISSDYGKTFQEITTSYSEAGTPNNVEMSANGKYQYFVGSLFTGILRSSDYGNNWSEILDNPYSDVAVSSSGQYVVLTRANDTLLSKDYGVTFTTASGLPTNVSLRNNAISSSGQIIVVTYISGVYVSTNFGISWKQTVLGFSNTHLSMSSTGQYIIVVGNNSSRIYTSSDYGATFVQINDASSPVLGISPTYSIVSANGQYQIIAHGAGMISSVDYGKTWVLNTNYFYRGIAMTSNGRIVVSATSSGAVMSTNYSTEFADRFKYDVSLNARLSVALDSSFNGNLFIGGSIVNTGLTSALALKAPLASPAFTGVPTSITAALGTNTTQIATTQYVRSEISALVASAPGTLDTLNELALALGNDAAFSTTVTNSIGLKAPSASPSFTGTFLVSSADASFNGNVYVAGAINNTGLSSALGLKAPLASPSFTGAVVSAGDVSLNTRLSVALDSSFNANLFVGGSIVNTGLSSALGLKAPLASPSFTGVVISAGDVSLNAGLSIALDSSFNSKLFISGNVGIGAGTANTPYKLDVCGNMRIFESVGTRASATEGSLIFEHADASGVSSIMFKSKNAANDYAYIQYEENGGNGNSGLSEKGVLTLGIENDPSLNTIKDTISLYPAAGQGFVGINTKGPVRNLDVSGGMAVSGDVSLNSTAFVKYLTNSFIVSTGASPGLTVTFPISRTYFLTDAAATNLIITLPTLLTSAETYIVTFKRTVYSVTGTMTFTTGGASANTQLIYPSQTSMLNGALHTQTSGSNYVYTNVGAGTHQFNTVTLLGVNNGTVVGWFEI